ncbi:MAG: ABC transporter transmembrane domain-containing protein, partial [Dehalococcoidia bacterium]
MSLLLAVAAGNDRPRPPLLVDGLLALVSEAQRAAFVGQIRSATPPQPGPDTSIWNAELAVARSRRQLPPVTALLRGPTDATGMVYQAAAGSFIGYLLRTYGAERFHGFARRLGPGNLDEALRQGMGLTLAQVERNWLRTLKDNRPGGILRFLRLSSVYLRPYKLKVTEIVFYLVLAVGFSLALQSVQRILIDRALPRTLPDGTLGGGDTRLFALIIGILVATFVVVSLTGLRENYLSAFVSESVTRELRIRIFTNVQRVHLGFFQRVQSGDILSRMTSDLAAIEFALTGALARGLQTMLTLVAATVTIFVMDARLAALALVGTPLFFVVGRWLGPVAARASFERQERLAAATTTLQENLSAQPVVKAFGLEGLQIGRYSRDLERLFRSSIRLTFLSSIFGLS